MAAVSKNSRTNVSTQRHFCTCGGEVKTRDLLVNGKKTTIAECEKCKRIERRPGAFK